MQKYIILRDLNARTGAAPGDFVFKGTRSQESAVVDLPSPGIETAELTPREASDAASRDPDVRGIGAVMPTILLAPLGGEAAAGTLADGDNWGIAAVGADASPVSGRGVTVAVLDTGIDAGHGAFQGITLDKRDFTTGVKGGEAVGPHPNWDVKGHGTHCAGTIFGRNVGAARIGVARGVQHALIGKVLDDNGDGTTEMLFQGLSWAILQGVDVISMSVGFDFPGRFARNMAKPGWTQRQAASDALVAYGDSLRLFDALMGMVRQRAQFNEGTVIVACSGNESDRLRDIRIATSLPAAAEGVISVGALGRKDGKQEVAFFSNASPVVSAPGVGILSAKPGGALALDSGTSMACPHVAGVAALWWEHLRQRSPDGKSSADEVITAMKASARREGVFASAYSKFDFGLGLVTAPRA